MVNFVYGREMNKSIDLDIGDFIIARYNQGIYVERPFFARVEELNVNRRPIALGISLAPAYRLYVDDQGEPQYSTPYSGSPALYQPQYLDDIWKGTPQELSNILRAEWEDLGPWAQILEKISKPNDIETYNLLDLSS